MVPVVERDTSPRATSMMYCSAIATCHEAREFGRASEWTHALGAWSDEDDGQLGGLLILIWRAGSEMGLTAHELR
jgi:hypothetical protein